MPHLAHAGGPPGECRTPMSRSRVMRELSVGDVPALSSLPDAVWSRIASSPRRLLILDYDGTLAPFNVDRGHALPARRTRAALEALIVGGESVVIVSGRPIAELHELLGGLPLRLIGEHGW